MSLDPDDVAEILALLDSLELDELRLRTPRFSLALRRSPGGWVQSAQVLTGPELHLPVDAAQTPAELAPAGPDREGLHEVRAPLVGTFYRAPKPGADAFVEVGNRVEATTVVGIVETMKLMNSVPAGVSGTVATILVEDGRFAEQDAVLMLIEPDGTEPGETGSDDG